MQYKGMTLPIRLQLKWFSEDLFAYNSSKKFLFWSYSKSNCHYLFLIHNRDVTIKLFMNVEDVEISK